MEATRILLLPGLGGSGPEHWQTLWEREYGYTRVLQDDWDRPALDAWVARLDEAVRGAPGPVALVAHSLACALVAHWARGAATGRVIGALLVAPADVDSEQRTPPEVRSFSPMPLDPLPFATIVAASRTDPYVDVARARHFARAWGAAFVDAGDAGHINAESGLGLWHEGHLLVSGLLGTDR
ncbi:RBBP9/YdeN family alpha/beta hydrolase [Sorangium sp. So ce388]|uniref:RBBP9/YdeN family alpha/beta hydrolase n=1 Tax=unclassified Sorangium TaxID=2621164 RepID=UPI003F5B354E